MCGVHLCGQIHYLCEWISLQKTNEAMIKSIHIQNFRVIKELHYECAAGMNVVVGVNGAGKTTLLSALVVLLSWFRARMVNSNGRGLPLTDNDITYGEDFCLLEITLTDGTEWKMYKQRSSNRDSPKTKSEYSSLTDEVNNLLRDFESSGRSISLPIIAYYGIQRAVDVPKNLHAWKNVSPLQIYSGKIDGRTNFRGFFEWFRTREDIENQERLDSELSYRDKQLEAVRRAVHKALPQYGELKVHRGPQYFYMEKSDGVKHRFEQFSDGEKCYITLFSDIARMLAIANPTLDNPLDGEGVVIIDEVDLHLHPAWQMKVIGILRDLFPNCQFFISTHSPIVTTNVDVSNDDKLLVARNGEIAPTSERIFGREVDRILLDLFAMETLRNDEVQECIDHIWSLLQAGDFESEEFDESLGALESLLPDDDPEFSRINQQIALLNNQPSL